MFPISQLRYGLTLSALLFLTSFKLPSVSRKITADRRASTVSYTMHHPIHTWDAVSHDVNCAMNYNDETKHIDNVAVSIKIASFDSGNGNRDSHGLEVMEGLKYPSVTFVSQSIQTGADGKLIIRGTLTFHGVVKPIVVQATETIANDQVTVEGGFDVSLTAHAVERPSFLGVKTDDTVKMTFAILFPL